MTPSSPSSEDSAEREVVSRRVFDAPREQLWTAFADPKRVALWWGPQGFTNTVHAMDVRPGGRWRLTMCAPDGTAFDNESEFREVVAPERIVFEHLEPVHRFRMTMSFATRGEKTELTWQMRFADVSECARVKRFIIAANEQNFDRLATYLLALR